MGELRTSECPNCKAPLTYNPDNRSFECEYCGSSFTKKQLENLASEEQTEPQGDENYETLEEDIDFEGYECPNCGAQVACLGTTATTFCVYCHTPIIHKGKLTGMKKPSRMVPFKFSREKAIEEFLKFVGKYYFVPKDFFSEEQLTFMQGVYYPFWLTDADTNASISVEGIKVRTWVSGDYEYTETSHYDVARAGDIHFEDIATSAIKEEDKRMLEGILPYPSKVLEPFSQLYLAGFLTKIKNIESYALEGEVQNKMKSYSRSLLEGTIHGYTRTYTRRSTMTVEQENWEYALFPIWLMTYKGTKRDYVYAMNGYTGKIYGELPIDVKKLVGVASIIFGAVALVVTLLGGFFL